MSVHVSLLHLWKRLSLPVQFYGLTLSVSYDLSLGEWPSARGEVTVKAGQDARSVHILEDKEQMIVVYNPAVKQNPSFLCFLKTISYRLGMIKHG